MKNNKTAWAVTLLLVLLTAAAGLTIKFWPRTVPAEQCSLIYRKYADMPGIKATYIKDYPLNDSITVNATILEANDTAILHSLQIEFFNKIYDDKDPHNKHLVFGQLYQWKGRFYLKEPCSPSEEDSSFFHYTTCYSSNEPNIISFFLIETDKQRRDLLDKQFDFMIPDSQK